MIPTMLIIQQWRAVNGMIIANPDVPLVRLPHAEKRAVLGTSVSTVVAGVTT